MPKVRIIPAILARTAAEAQRQTNRWRKLRVPVHIDLMDGKFVRTRSFSPRTLRTLHLPKGSEAHLMVQNPEAWVESCAAARIHHLILHVESRRSTSLVRRQQKNFKFTAALKPGTRIQRLRRLRRYIKGIQVMTVHPGKQGRPFLPRQLDVIRKLRRMFPRLPLSVDGSMNERTLPLARAAGASAIIVGSALGRSKNPLATFRKLGRLVV